MRKPHRVAFLVPELVVEGGDAPNECQDAQNVDKDICKLRIEGLPSWLQMMRGPAKK